MKGKDDLDDMDDISFQRILVNLLKGDKDLDLKTEITKPRELAKLKLLSEFLKDSKMIKTGSYIGGREDNEEEKKEEGFIGIYLRYMVSKDRESRRETIRAIQSLLDKETIKMSISDKMTTSLNK